jgi:hypothetical protein
VTGGVRQACDEAALQLVLPIPERCFRCERLMAMLQPPINDPAHWRSRADEARATALKMRDSQARKTMLVMAANCEWLAKRIEEGWRGRPE